MEKGLLYWITGLSGAGKTTIGNALYYELKKSRNDLVILDGDILKRLVGDSLGYSKDDRKKRAYYYSSLCKTLTDQGISVIICTIAMYDEVRAWNRKHIEKYIEVFLNVDKNVLLARDRKGLYSAQKAGKISQVAGMDQDVEFPKNPDIVIYNNGTESVEKCVDAILNYRIPQKDLYNRDTTYWNEFYDKQIALINEPSAFAKFALSYMEPGKKVMDIGCGNGRDSIYFAANNLDVIGVDASDTAITELQNKKIKNTFFVCDDFVTCKTLYQMQFDYFYSRWTIHAITEMQENELLHNISEALKENGLFFIEVRSTKDELYGKGKQIGRNTYEYNEHFRRFIEKAELIGKLEQQGFEVVYCEENKGFSKTKDSDPTLIRVVAKRRCKSE